MRISQTLVSSLARTQRSLTAPGPEDQEIIIPPIIVPSVALPFVLENCSTVPIVAPFSTSIIISDQADFAAAPVVRTFIVLDRGVWDIHWTVMFQCSVADAALDVGLQMQLVGPPLQSATMANFRGLAGQVSVSGRQVFSIPDSGLQFILVMGGTAAGVGAITAFISAQKLL